MSLGHAFKTLVKDWGNWPNLSMVVLSSATVGAIAYKYFVRAPEVVWDPKKRREGRDPEEERLMSNNDYHGNPVRKTAYKMPQIGDILQKEHAAGSRFEFKRPSITEIEAQAARERAGGKSAKAASSH